MSARAAECVVLLALCGLIPATGCSARTDAQAAETEDAKPKAASDVSAKPACPAEKKSPAERKKGHTHYAMVKNPAFCIKSPVLFDSGDEEDNSSCFVCHADFAEEKISTVHMEEAEMTCMACHGDSETHRADEYNTIRPDVLWGRGEMAAFCSQCHPKHKHPDKVEAFRKDHFSQRMPNGRWIDETSACLDCHGKHAITSGKEGEFK